MRIPITEVPIEVRRVAAQHLESMRGTELMTEAEDAYLDAFAVPAYRPDIDGIAYYEFTVVGRDSRRAGLLLTPGYSSALEADPRKAQEMVSARLKVSSESAGGRVIGFIVASNGRHDFPVAHWSLNRLPPSHQIAADPRTANRDNQRDVNVARLYKLDALAYAAEDENGDLMGQSGQLPCLLSGLPHSLDRFAGQIAYASARPMRAVSDDSSAQDIRHEVERSKDEPPALKWSDEGGWKALKERYTDAFGPLLDHLRTRATQTWELEDLIREFGEGIMAGTTHRVALLGEAAVEVQGEGAKYVEVSLEENPAGPPSLVLRALPVSLQQEVGLDVFVRYGSGEYEKLLFFVVSRDVPSNVKAERTRQRNSILED
jgi:hypothetical protein